MTGLLNRTTESIYYIIIGKLFSATELGFFSRALPLEALPSSVLATLVGRVTFPVFSKLQHDPNALKQGIRKTLVIVTFLICPTMIGIAAAARPIVVVLLTEKWAATIPYLRLLCVAGMLFPLEFIRQQAIQAVGRPGLSLRVEAIKKVILFVAIGTMWYWGVRGIIAGMIVASTFSLFLNIKCMATVTQYSVREQISDMVPYLVISFAMGVAVFGLGYLLRHHHPLYQLMVQVIAGFVFYAGSTWIFRVPACTAIREACDWGQVFRHGAQTGIFLPARWKAESHGQ